jgi:hypothetical protein
MLHHEPPKPADPTSDAVPQDAASADKPAEPAAKPPADDAETTRLLRAAAKRKRPWTLGSLLITLLFLGLPIAVLVWWFWPRPEPRPLLVVGLDRLVRPDETPTLIGLVDVAELEASRPNLEERVVRLEAIDTANLVGGKSIERTEKTDARGVARFAWDKPLKHELTTFYLHHFDPVLQKPSKDSIRVFLWPRNAKVVAVDVASLSDAGEQLWQTERSGEHSPLPAALKALRAARAKGFRVVYLATDPERPLHYRLARGWVMNNTLGADEAFPEGPVLGRTTYGEALDRGEARRRVVEELKQRYQGPIVGVVPDEAAAKTFRDAGLSAVVAPPAGKDWDAVVKALPQ